MADVRCEILACTHRLDLTMRHIKLLSTAYTDLESRLGSSLPPVDHAILPVATAASSSAEVDT